MIKTLRIMSILAVALAAVLVVFSVVVFGARGDKDIAELLSEPGVIEKFNNSAGNKSMRGTNEVSPLVQQAGAFALYLNPPEPPAPRPVKGSPSIVKRAPSATPKFKVMGTSYYKGHPESSMALIDEPGKGLHWVRQSSMVGHLLIQEVKDGIVVVKDNSGTFELKAEETPHISLIEGAPAVPSTPAGVSKSPVSRSVSRSPAEASVKPSTVYSGKTGSGYVKPRPPLPRKTNEQDSVMEEVTKKMAELQRIFKTSSELTEQEKAAKMNEVLEEIKVLRSEDITKQDEEKLSRFSKGLKDVIEKPASSDQK